MVVAVVVAVIVLVVVVVLVVSRWWQRWLGEVGWDGGSGSRLPCGRRHCCCAALNISPWSFAFFSVPF
jgi:hypothetical protein